MKKALALLLLVATSGVFAKRTFKVDKGDSKTTINVDGKVGKVGPGVVEVDEHGHIKASDDMSEMMDALMFDMKAEEAKMKHDARVEAARMEAKIKAEKEEAAHKKEKAPKAKKAKPVSHRHTVIEHSDHHRVIKDEHGEMWHCSKMHPAHHDAVVHSDAKPAKAQKYATKKAKRAEKAAVKAAH